MITKIKRFIDCNVPTATCNLKCPYCYIGRVDGFSGEIKVIPHAPAQVRAALSKKRLGGTILINFCATGETLLGNDILPIIYEILREGHYVQIVTNGTVSKRFEEISGWEKELLDRLMIKFSFHYSELLRLNLLNPFFDNILLVKQAGVSISLEITPGDEMVPYIEDMKKISMEKLGALPHVTVARDTRTSELKMFTQYSYEEYQNIWGSFDSPLFDLKMKLFSEKRTEYCYGGEWTLYLNLFSGELRQCYKGDVIDNIFRNIEEPLHFKPIGKECRECYCYNGHAWMTLGCIPNMDLPTYSDVRNRITINKEEWLGEGFKEFISHRLEERNVVYENVSDVPKVLLLGDSISEGYRELVAGKLLGTADVYYPNENVKYSVNLLRYIREWAERMKIGSNIDFVYFNVGLWDLLRISGIEPLTSLDEYSKNLINILGLLKTIFCNAHIIFATISSVNETLMEYELVRYNADIDKYNRAACEIMEMQGVQIHDLNKITKEYLSNMYADFTHFTQEGYEILADEIVAYLKTLLSVSGKAVLAAKVVDEEVIQGVYPLGNKGVILYGAGTYGEKVIGYLQQKGISIKHICDMSSEKQGKTICGIEIISPQEYINRHMDIEKDVVLIAIKDQYVTRKVISTVMNVSGLHLCTLAAFKEIE